MTEEPQEQKMPKAVKVFMMSFSVLLGTGLAMLQVMIWVFGDVSFIDEASFPQYLGTAAVFAFLAAGPFAAIAAKRK